MATKKFDLFGVRDSTPPPYHHASRIVDSMQPILASATAPWPYRLLVRNVYMALLCVAYLQELCVHSLVENVRGHPRLLSASTECIHWPRVKPQPDMRSFTFYGSTDSGPDLDLGELRSPEHFMFGGPLIYRNQNTWQLTKTRHRGPFIACNWNRQVMHTYKD